MEQINVAFLSENIFLSVGVIILLNQMTHAKWPLGERERETFYKLEMLQLSYEMFI